MAVTAACMFALPQTSQADSSSNPSSILELEKIRARTSAYIGNYLIEVQGNCKARSHLPNEVNNYWISWEGPCANGYASGEGIKRLKAGGRPLSAYKGSYDNGVWTNKDGYEISLGRIVHVTIQENGISKRIEVADGQASTLPPWATDLVAELPRAKEEWAANVKYRIEERARAMSVLSQQGQDKEDEESDLIDLFKGEEVDKN